MEEIYRPENYSASSRISLDKYFEEFNDVVSSSEEPLTYNSKEQSNENNLNYLLNIKNLMGVDIDIGDLRQLSESCSVDYLTCEGENKDFPIELPEQLKSTTKLPTAYVYPCGINQLVVNKCRSNLETKAPSQLSLCYKRIYHNCLEFPIPSTAPNLSPGSDFIISIMMYKPFAFKFFSTKNASEKLRFNFEIVALGNNLLTELRDTILCSADVGLCKEVQSTSEDLRPLADSRKQYPSGFLFIDNTFYNDFRDPNAIDYSFPLMEWTKQKKIKTLEANNMENVSINELTPRFGYPYLYMHQGDCEHLLVFTDARLVDQNDCLHSECYPHVLKLNRDNNKMCFMCTVSFAKWICVDSDRLPQNKVFLCTDCCNAYNYIDGEKIGNFKLYPYYEKHVVE